MFLTVTPLFFGDFALPDDQFLRICLDDAKLIGHGHLVLLLGVHRVLGTLVVHFGQFVEYDLI